MQIKILEVRNPRTRPGNEILRFRIGTSKNQSALASLFKKFLTKKTFRVKEKITQRIIIASTISINIYINSFDFKYFKMLLYFIEYAKNLITYHVIKKNSIRLLILCYNVFYVQ